MTRLHQSREPNRYRKRGMFFEVYMGDKTLSIRTSNLGGLKSLHTFFLFMTHLRRMVNNQYKGKIIKAEWRKKEFSELDCSGF